MASASGRAATIFWLGLATLPALPASAGVGAPSPGVEASPRPSASGVARATVGATSEAEGSAPPRPRHPIDSKLPGPESRYTQALLDRLRSWPPKDIDYGSRDPNPVRMKAIETPGAKYFIGLEQVMVVDAPIARVAGVLDDVEHYQELFVGFDEVKAHSRDGNRFVVFWEQHIPVFFVPNVRYEAWYLVDDSSPDRRVYRYQLKDGRGHIKSQDGMIVIEREGTSRTRYTEYDFFDAEWGALETFAPGRIWKDSVEGLYLSDVAIKLKAENPSWSYERIREEGKKCLERFPVEPVLAQRKRF